MDTEHAGCVRVAGMCHKRASRLRSGAAPACTGHVIWSPRRHLAEPPSTPGDRHVSWDPPGVHAMQYGTPARSYAPTAVHIRGLALTKARPPRSRCLKVIPERPGGSRTTRLPTNRSMGVPSEKSQSGGPHCGISALGRGLDTDLVDAVDVSSAAPTAHSPWPMPIPTTRGHSHTHPRTAPWNLGPIPRRSTTCSFF